MTELFIIAIATGIAIAFMASYFDAMYIIKAIRINLIRIKGRIRYRWWKFRYPEAAAELEDVFERLIDECPNTKSAAELWNLDIDDDDE